MVFAVKITKDPATKEQAVDAVRGANDNDCVTISIKLYLVNTQIRQRAINLVQRLTSGWRVRIAKRNRSEEQNALMWVILKDISLAEPEGRKMVPEVWKSVFMRACKHEIQFEVGLDGRMFPIGMSTKNLKVAEMSDLIEYIYWYGAKHDVKFSQKPNEYER